MRQPTSPPRAPEEELLDVMARQSRRVRPVLWLMCSCMALLISARIDGKLPLVWLCVMLPASTLHVWHLGRLPEWTHLTVEHRLRRAMLSYTVHGLLLSLLLLAFSRVPFGLQGVLSLYCLGLTVAMMPAVMGHPQLFTPYLAVQVMPLAVCWLLAASDFSWPQRILFTVLVLLTGLALVVHSRRLYRLFTESHNARLEHWQLQRHMEQSLRRLEDASHAKTRFFAAASHDLRQPIHALTLLSGALRAQPLSTKSARIVQQIATCTEQLARQMDALLDLSRLDAGAVAVRHEPVALITLVQDLVAQFQPQAEDAGVRLRLELPPMDVLAEADGALLERVLQNLIANAVKYSPGGDVVVNITADGARLLLSVQDTGIGIAEDEQQRIFEEFYQLDNPSRDRSRGLGLGLAIVRRLCALMDIPLQLQSRLGEGSVFSLILQRTVLPPAVRTPETPNLAALLGLEVLVVDDEPTNREGLQHLLESHGMAVRIAGNSLEAMRLAESQTPQFVLCDWKLGGNDDGLLTLRKLRDRWPGLPAILLSADAAPDKSARYSGLDNLPLLHKPVRPEPLLKAMERCLRAA